MKFLYVWKFKLCWIEPLNENSWMYENSNFAGSNLPHAKVCDDECYCICVYVWYDCRVLATFPSPRYVCVVFVGYAWFLYFYHVRAWAAIAETRGDNLHWSKCCYIRSTGFVCKRNVIPSLTRWSYVSFCNEPVIILWSMQGVLCLLAHRLSPGFCLVDATWRCRMELDNGNTAFSE